LLATRGAGALLLPLRPLMRWTFLHGFGFLYRYLPEAMPTETRALHFVDRRVERFLDVYGIDLLVLPEDNFYYLTNLYVKAMQARGGATVIVPFTIVNVLEWAEAFKDLRSHDARILLNWPIAMLFPKWCYEHGGKHLVMPAFVVLGNEYLRIAPPVPWLINSGGADAIAAESTFMQRYYRSAGIPEAKLHFTGALTDDVLYRALEEASTRREALYERLGLPPGRPLIVCAMPPNQLTGAGRPTCDFSDYRALMRFFVEPLEALADEYNVVVNLHPRILPDDAAVLDGLRLRVAPGSIADLVPLAHFYVASCSATIRLAVSCGIPVVNYDVYRYDYDDFKRVPGVLAMEEKHQYEEAVRMLAGSDGRYAAIRSSQEEFARQESLLDGGAGARILALFDELTQQRRAIA
jgi:hypothetical protein